VAEQVREVAELAAVDEPAVRVDERLELGQQVDAADAGGVAAGRLDEEGQLGGGAGVGRVGRSNGAPCV
jgi:hypothetical protein